MIKLGTLLCTLLGITLIAFFVIRLAPGNPVLLMIGERGADPRQYQEALHRLSLDRPLFEQYLGFVGRASGGDFGSSIVSGRSVQTELLARWPATIELGVAVILLSLLVGVPAGVIAAIRRRSVVDKLITVGSLIGYSMPVFWLGLVLILVFSEMLGLTPVSGRLDIAFDIRPATGFMLIDTLLPEATARYGLDAFFSALHHLLLPTLTMAATPIAVFARMTRASMSEVLGEDYIRTARAKGLAALRIIWLHALRNALLPVITVGGLFFVSSAIAGAILTETIFGWPGVGSYIVNSVYARDYPVIQGSILLIGVLVILTNAGVDLLYRVANPRMRV
ncbi:dipeptide ABC transporter permease DppB [Chromobacterium sp. ATCC 53434]|uniref:ABC transporter permease n=1 Tax=Chromobacterium sp. (strain ATCC 53434 / SC 14030) TaxID=2059672 RepID=UPI000C78A538|nr:ABC transporter permease [Chromobacterium sp. ATCC 53434]AUH49400.1 dipeptide ABC transporter permease DppB [Chromobacterium sp. ATCC 53434]